MRLYEIPEKYRQALESVDIDEETGEIINADALNQFEMDAKEKIENAALFCRELDRESTVLSEEADRMIDRSKSMVKKAERIKSLILPALQAFNGKVKTARVTVYERKTESVVVDDIERIPDSFKKTKTEVIVSKTSLKKAIQSGENISGAHLEEKTIVAMR